MTKLHSVGQIAITVHDLERAVNFYRDILGLEFVWQTNGMAFFGDTEGNVLAVQSEVATELI